MSHLSDDNLNLYLDDVLTAETRADAERHLAACPACRARLDALRALVARFGDLTVEPIPLDLAPLVVRRIACRARIGRLERAGALVLVVQVVAAALLVGWLLPEWATLGVTATADLVGAWLAQPVSIFLAAGTSLGPDVGLFGALGASGDALGAVPTPSLLFLAACAALWILGNRLLIVGRVWSAGDPSGRAQPPGGGAA